MKAITKHAGGRPTKYTPDIFPKIEEYLVSCSKEQMTLPTIEGLSLYLGVNTDTINEWAKTYHEFSATIKKLVAKQKQQLMDDGMYGGKEVNAAMAIFLLKVNHGMKDGEGGTKVNILVIPGELAEKYGVALNTEVSG